MVNVWQKNFSRNLFGYVRHVEEWLFDGWNFVIPTDVGILCYWQRCGPITIGTESFPLDKDAEINSA